MQIGMAHLEYIAMTKQLAPKIVYKFPKDKTQILEVKKEGGSHVLKKLNLEEFLQLGWQVSSEFQGNQDKRIKMTYEGLFNLSFIPWSHQ